MTTSSIELQSIVYGALQVSKKFSKSTISTDHPIATLPALMADLKEVEGR